jgi:hypothetical protein
MQMEKSVTRNNLDILSNLQPYEKLIVDENMNLSVDTRYIQFMRRTATGDSKYDILIPIELTFNSQIISDEEKLVILKHVGDTLLLTYPDFPEMHSEGEDKEGLLSKLKREIQKQKSDKLIQEAGKGFASLVDAKRNKLTEEEQMKKEDEKEQPKMSFIEAALKGKQSSTVKRPPPPPQKPDSNSHRLLSLSDELAEFLNVRNTCKLSTKEIELGIHKYILKNKLYSRVTHKITLDCKLASLCQCEKNTNITNDVMKAYIFSHHVNN